MLSVIIITKNEESHIEKCLESVKWADEIIILDSGSSDKTVSICHQFTQHVFETDYQLSNREKKHRLVRKIEKLLSVDLSKKHYHLI